MTEYEAHEIARVHKDKFDISIVATNTLRHGPKGIEILEDFDDGYIIIVPLNVATNWNNRNKMRAIERLTQFCQERYDETH